MKVLIIGSGAREHALASSISQSPLVTGLWVANGNAGTAQVAANLSAQPDDLEVLIDAACSLPADLVVVGPELPLAAGIVDRLDLRGIPAFGPTRAAAQIEASKSFALQLMAEAGVPCPDFRVFRDQTEALDFVGQHSMPTVVKADGLAAGKGVRVCATRSEAAEAVRECMTGGIFGEAGRTVVLQELLLGTELSVFGFSDGEHLSPLVAACDYKRLLDGDEGPNTGGMGSFATPEFWSDSLASEIATTIMQPVVHALARRGTPYKGVLYAGLMITESGPKVLEFNCRLGDPEAQVILPLLQPNPLDIMLAAVEGRLDRVEVGTTGQYCVGVVVASKGYPGEYDTGFEIVGLDPNEPDSFVFHAGTRLDNSVPPGKVVTSGGRVLTVVGRGDSLAQARTRAYDKVDRVQFNSAYHRDDIGVPGNRNTSWVRDSVTQTG